MKNIKDFNSFITEGKKEKPQRTYDEKKDDIIEYRRKIEEVINDQFTPEEKRLPILSKNEIEGEQRSGQIITEIRVNSPNEGEQDFNVNATIFVGNSSHSPAYSIRLYPDVTLKDALWRDRNFDYLSNESIDKLVKMANVVNTYTKVNHKMFDKIVDAMYTFFSEAYLNEN